MEPGIFTADLLVVARDDAGGFQLLAFYLNPANSASDVTI